MNRRIRYYNYILVFIAALIPPLTFAQTGQITGTVTNGTEALSGFLNVYKASNQSFVKQVTYNPSSGGVFNVTNLDDDSYIIQTLFAQTTGGVSHVDEMYNNIPCISGICNLTLGTPITISGGNTVSGINFVLSEASVISGTITTNGVPLADTFIALYNSSGVLLTSRKSAANGAYGIGGVPAGTFYLTAYNVSGYRTELFDNLPCIGPQCVITSGTSVVVSGSPAVYTANFDLLPGGRISGRVIAQNNSSPLANSDIDIYDSSGNIITGGTTDANGNYTSDAGLPDGTYFASASSSGYISRIYKDTPCGTRCTATSGTSIFITGGATVSGIDFSLPEKSSGANVDLSGSWSPVKKKPNTYKLIIRNTGTDRAGGFLLKLYKLEKRKITASSRVAKTIAVDTIESKASRTFTFKAIKSKKIKFIFGVIDAGLEITETKENNNSPVKRL